MFAHSVCAAIDSYTGTLKGVPATEPGTIVVRETLRRSGLLAGDIETVVQGNVIPAGNRMNPARQAVIRGGVLVSGPALTVAARDAF